MPEGIVKIPKPVNEPILPYTPATSERKDIKSTLEKMLSQNPIEIPLIIGGKEVKTGNKVEIRMPSNHDHILGTYHKAGTNEVEMAIDAALEAWNQWSEMDWESRLSVFLKMGELLTGPHRMTLNAATMLGQAKNIFQAEIDAACELIDFWRFNPYYLSQLYQDQPMYSPRGQWNYVHYRPLEGFVFAVTPFNFTSIAGNLPTSPAMCGNVVLWKPASGGPVYSAYYLMKLFKDAGLPPGVINFLPGSGGEVGDPVIDSPHLAGIHFTGSTAVFQSMWKKIGMNIEKYHTYPRIVGETGGKDFVFVHNSAGIEETTTGLIRGAFEYAGQKCSAASRAYFPESIWPQIKESMQKMLSDIKMGDVMDFSNLINSVIDKAAFSNITRYIDEAKQSPDAEILFGGSYDDSKGYYISPTVILAKKPDYVTMCDELFGPVLTVYIYPDDKYIETLKLCDQTSPYGLTGGIFANDRRAINTALKYLKHSSGNFYINDKPTGAVVGQQPFGGSRASGTNDKAGSKQNLLRWLSVRSIKENFNPPKHPNYPYMVEP
ncbi:MAG: L-glutamate gamma-semialdehyde dehydrogenase [Candidatus Hodarchaeales archaeon]|jgi:1-pyrroline-5-carboxylate dehydrogenase